MYKLSILIPSRNEMWLSKTIEDILEHSGEETEVIVGLDGLWADPPIADHKRVTIVHVSESIGQRAMTNQLCRLSKAKYVMKIDAHVAMDQDFDKKMFALFDKVGDNCTIAPTMRNLHVFNWLCKNGHRRYQGPSGPCNECKEPTEREVVWIPKTNPSSTSYLFDPEPHFQYFNEFKNRPEYSADPDYNESMSLQGSCFMLTRDKYWELNICDEEFGSWGSQGIEVACKTWLSGGRVIINHKTWYAHLFRTQGGDFGFPYEISGKQTEHAKKLAKEVFFGNKLPNQIHPLSWLVEKFWPVPKWTEQDLIAIGGKVPTTPDRTQSEPTRGCIFYTDNLVDERVGKAVRKQLWKAATRDNGLPIVSCSLKPLDFGTNIVLNEKRGYLTMFKQILTALENLNTDIVYFCEHDVLYHPDHFKFIPPKKDVWYYDENYWFLRLDDGFAISYDCSPLSGLVVYRDAAIKHYRERVEMFEKDPNTSVYQVGFEPMTHGRIKWKNMYGFETFMSPNPSIDVSHGSNVTKKRWSIDLFRRKPKRWVEGNVDTITGWDNVKKLLA